MATETAMPSAATAVATSQQYRDRYRPAQPDMVDDAYGGGQLAVSNPSGRTINIANGGAVVQAARYDLTSGPLAFTAATNVGGGSTRFDVVCLTYDSSHTPIVYGRIVQGTAGAGIPTLTNSLTGVWDFPIAHYAITTSDVITLTDRRKFSDGYGGVLAADDATGTFTSIGAGWFPVAPRVGQRCTFWPSDTEWRWSGTAWRVHGAGRPNAAMIRTTTQSIPDSAQTTLAFNATDPYDAWAMHNPASNNTRMVIPFPGLWHVNVEVPWAPNVTGIRELKVAASGGSSYNGNRWNSAGNVTQVSVFAGDIVFAAGEYFECTVYQSSGGALNVDGTFGGGIRASCHLVYGT
jgi:hypothetical protein